MTAEELYMQNRPLVRIGLRVAGIDEPDEDWLQNGRMWLWQACLAFDQEKGCKFSTLAVTAVYRGAKNLLEYRDRLCRRGDPISLTRENGEGEEEQIDIMDDSWDPDERMRIRCFWAAAERTLSKRDFDMLKMTAKGYTCADIARAYGLSPTRVNWIYQKRIRPLASDHLERRHSR